MILIFYPKLTSDFRNFLKSVLGFKKGTIVSHLKSKISMSSNTSHHINNSK